MKTKAFSIENCFFLTFYDTNLRLFDCLLLRHQWSWLSPFIFCYPHLSTQTILLVVFPSTDDNLERFGLNGHPVVRLEVPNGAIWPNVQLMHDVGKEKVNFHVHQSLTRAPPLPQTKGDEVIRDAQPAMRI